MDPMPPLKGYSLWLMGSGKGWQSLQRLMSLSQAIALSDSTFFAHATLIGLLDFRSIQKDELEQGALQLAQTCNPLTIEVTGIGMRDVYFQSMFLPIQPSVELMQLNTQARRIFKHENDPPFMPHLSLIYGYPKWLIKAEIAKMLMLEIQFPLSITLDQLALVRVDGYPHEWEIEAKFPLRK